MGKTIANKLTLRVALLLALALLVLSVGSYHAVSGIVRDESENYTESIASIYADFIVTEMNSTHLPLNLSSAEEINFYGEYLCRWYRIDYTFAYIPDIENNCYQLIGFATKDGLFENVSTGSYVGQVVPHTFSDEELAVWNDEEIYFISESDDIEHAMVTVTAANDTFGNRVFVGVGISLQDITDNIQGKYLPVVLILLAVFFSMIVIIYLIIRRNVRRPAKRISEAMTAFIQNGKRAEIRLDENGNDEFAMITKAFNSMTDDINEYIENIHKLNRDQERQKAEIEIASNIQQGFLPAGQMSSKAFEIHATMTPAKDIGGDLYDYLPLDDERTLVTIADVSGKGIAASMYMAVTLMLVRQFAKMGQSPSEILKSTNNAISEKNPRMLFETAFVGIFDSRTKMLTYSNAGHNLPYIIGKTPRLLCGATNTLLGLFPDEEYTEETVKLEVGETLFLYTDGVTEATNEEKDFYGCERLEATLGDAVSANADNIVDAVNASIRDFAKDSDPHDDITMLTLTPKESTELSLDIDTGEFERIKGAILSSPLPYNVQLDLCVAAEEAFVNICSYAFEGGVTEGEKVGFSLEVSDRAVMRFTDGGMPYDPRENVISADDYDLDLQIGGLGKLIAFSVTDAVDYEYTDRKNVLTFTKYIKENKNDDRSNE